jgi:hypothetical protein
MVSGFFCLNMSTSVKLEKRFDMQYCGECVHCIHDSAIFYCDLGKWKINKMNEYFFYDPKVPMHERSVIDDMEEEIWEYSLMCKGFYGNAYLVTDITCSTRTNGYAEFIIETVPKYRNTYNRTVHFFANDNKSIINKWLRTIEIL